MHKSIEKFPTYLYTDIRAGGGLLVLKCTGIPEFFSYFLALGRQPLPVMSEKSPFVRAGCFSKSHTVPIYYTNDKMTW